MFQQSASIQLTDRLQKCTSIAISWKSSATLLHSGDSEVGMEKCCMSRACTLLYQLFMLNALSEAATPKRSMMLKYMIAFLHSQAVYLQGEEEIYNKGRRDFIVFGWNHYCISISYYITLNSSLLTWNVVAVTDQKVLGDEVWVVTMTSKRWIFKRIIE